MFSLVQGSSLRLRCPPSPVIVGFVLVPHCHEGAVAFPQQQSTARTPKDPTTSFGLPKALTNSKGQRMIWKERISQKAVTYRNPVELMSNQDRRAELGFTSALRKITVPYPDTAWC